MKTPIVITLLFLLLALSNCHNPYKGMCKEDRQKMKMVARYNKAVAAGKGCPASKEDGTQREAEEKLAKKSRKQAAKKK